MKEAYLKKVIDYLLLIFCCTLFFLLPYFYEERIHHGIYKNDIYLIGALGTLCWGYCFFYRTIIFTEISVPVFLSILYVIFLFFLKSHNDSNSVDIVIVLIGAIGIINYFISVNKSNLYIILLVTIIIAYVYQLYCGWKQAQENNDYDLAITGQLFNSGFFANYLALLLPMLLSCFLAFSVKGAIKISCLIIFSFSLVLILLTHARAAIVGSFTGCGLVVISSLRVNFKGILKRKVKAITIIFVLVFVSIIATNLYNLKPQSALGRITIYKVCLAIIRDHPFWGVGPNRFSAVYNDYQSDYFKNENIPAKTQILASNTFEAFNSVLQILIEYGIIGLLLLGWIIYLVVKKMFINTTFPNKQWLSLGGLGSITCIIVCSLFSNPFHCSPIFFAFIYLLSLPISQIQILHRSYRLGAKLFLFIQCFVLILIIYTGYYFLEQHQAETNWFKASENSKYIGFKSAEPFYNKAYPRLKTSGYFLYNYGAEANLASNYEFSIRLLEESTKYYSFSNTYLLLGDDYNATDKFKLAEENYLKAINIVPVEIYPKFQLVNLYMKWKKWDEAETWIGRTLSWPIKVKSLFTDNLIKRLQISGDSISKNIFNGHYAK